MNIQFLQYLYIAFTLLGLSMFSSCSENDELSSPMFVNNAKLQEEGQTLYPGDIVHLEGEGYLETDDVMLNIFWKTGDKYIPEGAIMAYYAKVLTKSKNGILVQMPYRKPASRVEISILRSGEMMKIGTVYLSDGTTLSSLQLYGIVNHCKYISSQANQIKRWLDSDNGLSDLQTWTLDSHSDFHSTVGAYRAYGICGLSKENGKQYPYFFDLLTEEWKKLSTFNTIALFTNLTEIYAMSSNDGKFYMADCVSSGIERSNYATSSRALSPAPDFRFVLPDDIKPEFFGDYPGVCYDTSNVLFSVNKGNGKWTPVLFNFRKGFSVLDDIEADALIPFSTYLETKYSDGKSQISGYIIVLKEIKDGVQSLFYTISENLILSDEPFTIFPNRVLSVSSNHDKPGTLTVHFEVNRHENVTYELSLQNNDWSPINSVETFDEIVWIN